MASGPELVPGDREDWLAPGERVVVEAKPHWKVFAGLLIAGLIVGLVLAGLGYWHAEHAEQVARGERLRANLLPHRIAEHKRHGLIAEVAGGAVFLLALVVGFVRWRAPRYFITDQRVVVRRGWLVRAGTEVPLGKVVAVGFRQGVVDRLCKTGTIAVSSGGLRAVRLWSVREPQEAQAKIYEGQRAAAQQVGSRHLSPPPVSQFGPGGGGFAPQPKHPPSAIVPPAPRQGQDGPPIPPWAQDEPDAPGLNL